MKNDAFDNTDNSQLVLSVELLQLIEWIIDNQADEFKNLIRRALKTGLSRELKRSEELSNQLSPEDLQNSLSDFFGLMEVLLIETMNECKTLTPQQESAALNDLGRIDTATCGKNIVTSSIAETSIKLEEHPTKNAQQLFYETLLENWTPSKKTSIN